MAFRLINNRFQDIGAKGFAVVLIASTVLHFTGVLSITVTLPFLMPFILLWFIGYSMINRTDKGDEQ